MDQKNKADLIDRVNLLLQEGRYITALDQILMVLDSDPNDEEALMLAASAFSIAYGPGHNYNPAEPITEEYFSNPLFDSVFCECQGLRDGKLCPRHWVIPPWQSEGLVLLLFNPAGGICPNCDKVFCKECSTNRKDNSLVCPDCGVTLKPISKPNGRTSQQTRRRKEQLGLVIMLHEGPVPPTDEYLTQKFKRISPDILNDKPEIKVLPAFPWPDNNRDLARRAKDVIESLNVRFDLSNIDDYFFTDLDDEGSRFYLVKVYGLESINQTVNNSANPQPSIMDFLSRLFGKKISMSPQGDLTEAQKLQIEQLLKDLNNEHNIEARIRACEELGKLKSYGTIDVVSALGLAAKDAAMQWIVKRMTAAMMQGVRPEQIRINPHADDSRVTIAVVRVLRALVKRNDEISRQAKSTLEDIRNSIDDTELVAKIQS